ncbi:MAG: 3-dehydroquinate synthase [Gammaproteobacteria bacterium]|nr:3-dehydroquinate synthase [Gammaproteobacteria bacterium]
MRKLSLFEGEKRYTISIGSDNLFQSLLPEQIKDSNQILLLSDTNVTQHYQQIWAEIFSGSKFHVLQIPAGEREKSLLNFSKIIDFLIEHQFRRNDVIVTFSGGMIGDLGGFTASCYQRGMRLIHCPTSLLAQIDSSVGGKTAINHPSGKNLIGSFYQPEAVIIDVSTLQTLPDREFISAFAEIVKYALLGNKHIEEMLFNQLEGIISRDSELLETLVFYCCEHKASIVSQDEKETGHRALLNLGHSFGHAIEKLTDYQSYLHGEAVSIGLMMAMKLSELKGIVDEQYVDKYAKLLQDIGLPLCVKENITAEEILNAMARDKKNLNENLRLVLPEKQGCNLYEFSEKDLIKKAIKQQL